MMAGDSSVAEMTRCEHYAGFASHLDRKHFDILYWLLFLFVILMLFVSSWYYSRSMEKVDGFKPGSPEHGRQMYKCLWICLCCSVPSVVAVVMEVYALMALQFCDGEDLIALYWSTWTMLQVGSLMAIFGVLLNVWHSIRGRKHPPWALALGTPILVIAGLGHLLHSVLHKRVKQITTDKPRAMSQANTLCGDEETEENIDAKFVGFTADGGAIIQFTSEPQTPLAQSAMYLGTNHDGHVTVAFQRDAIQIVMNGAPAAGAGADGDSTAANSPRRATFDSGKSSR